MADRGFGHCAALGLALAVALTVAAAPGYAANIEIGGGNRLNVPLRSMTELRDANLVRQRFDYSCGAAALATILRYGFGVDITERDILNQLFEVLSEEQEAVSRKEGFSLLDLQRVAHALGYNAQGFRIAADSLQKLRGPVIVFIEPRGYKHFAVLRGVKDNRVFLADPSRGNIRMPAYVFLESWLREEDKGIIFVVEPKSGLPDKKMPLALSDSDAGQLEIMTVRELLDVGNPFVRFPDLFR